MRKPLNDARGDYSVALWSGFIALWRAGARRPAWPLLMALLLFVSTPFAAPMNCSLEVGEHSHTSEVAESHSHSEGDYHHHHAAVAHLNSATLQAPATCCSCSSETINATVVAVNSPRQHKADSHAVIYAVTDAVPVYRFDSLRGLHTRAGPFAGKPQRLSLVSHIGPAPPLLL